MKKVLSICLMCALSLLLAGCGKKQVLDCSIDFSDQLYGLGTMEANIKFYFEGNSFENADVAYDIRITSDLVTNSDMTTLKANVDSICDEGNLGGIKLSTCKSTLDGKNITLKATIVKKDIEDQSETYGSINATKKDLESMGYTCKIK